VLLTSTVEDGTPLLRRTSVCEANLAAGRIYSARGSEKIYGVPAQPAAWGNKKRMRSLGSVEVPQEAFMAVLKLDE